MVDVGTIWTAGGVLVGLQLTAFIVRINRGIAVASSGRATWLPLADALNLGSMVITAMGVFVGPALDLGGTRLAARALGLALVLFVGYPFALAGHYELFNRRPRGAHHYCPTQERVVLAIVGVVAVAYLILAIVR